MFVSDNIQFYHFFQMIPFIWMKVSIIGFYVMDVVWFIYLKSNPGIDCSLLWCTRHRKMLCNFFLTNVVTNGSILFSITSLRFAFWPFICSDKAKTSKECNNIIELVICFPIKWYAWLILPRLLYSQLWI